MFKYFLSTCLLFSVFLVLSCGNQAEPPRQPKVITKKLIIKKDISASNISKPKIEKTIKEPVALSSPKPDKAGKEIMILKPEPVAAETRLYNPEGKIDPFAPLFREEKLAVRDGETMETGKAGICIPHTPLQRADLSQLKLTGIICASSGNRAMVEEASGMGYVIKKGAFIGINCGRVTQILKDRIIVEEPLLPVEDVEKDSVYDVDGKSFFITEIDGKSFINIDYKQVKTKITKINGRAYYIDPQELKLQKPSG
ncbi:MAG: pilus assembly protein PilP [Thermodesulfobacteriota bacterium]|nr:pilus assembly protein PilP [Thermodesulfobacteriota bacterium]